MSGVLNLGAAARAASSLPPGCLHASRRRFASALLTLARDWASQRVHNPLILRTLPGSRPRHCHRCKSKVLDRDDPEGALGTVMFGDGDVITRNEVVAVEFEPRFIVIGTLRIVIEGPAATRATHQISQFVPLTRPEALRDTARASSAIRRRGGGHFAREALETRNRGPCCLQGTRGRGRAPVEYVSRTWRVISSRPSLLAATRSCSDAVFARRGSSLACQG